MEPERAEDFVSFLVETQRYNEAAKQLVSILDNEFFVSMHGKSKYQFWGDLCDLICQHPQDLESIRVEPIIRAGIKRFSDQVGKLWNALAKYWILKGNLEKVSSIIERSQFNMAGARCVRGGN